MLLLVNVKVAVPAATAVTTPPLVTVATDGLLLAQVPPLAGDNVVVEPIQMLLAPEIPTVGKAFTVTAGVGAEAQPVAVLVNVNVAEPAARAVTTPLLLTLAIVRALLAQVPPLVGESVVVEPIQMLLTPVMLTIGAAFTVIALVGAEEQPVSELVKVNITVPAETPVTTPALVTVAIAGLLLAQVPPVLGDNVVVAPTQMLVGPVMLAVGNAPTVTELVGIDTQPVVVLVNVNATVPAETPVTTPAFVTVATAGLLLAQVPPEVGVRFVVAPTQIVLPPVMLTTGIAFTVTGAVAADTQPVLVLVKVNVAVPAATPVTTPALVTVATAGLLLTQVPPVVGDKPVVLPTQMLVAPVMLTTGVGFTVTGKVEADTQPVTELVKVNVTEPDATPVTKPPFVTVAMAGLLLAHTPPVVGDNVVVPPTQILLPPVMLTTGRALTLTAGVGAEIQPVVVLVKVNIAVPADIPVTTPALVTVAIAALLLAHVPPLVGESVVVEPTQMVVEPVILPAGVLFTVIAGVGAETHPVVVLVKVNIAVPAATAVTTPAFVTVATAGLLLTQVPPEDGDRPVVAPMQRLVGPIIDTVGVGATVTEPVGTDTQPVVELVNTNVALPADTPVTMPEFVTVATAGFVLTQVPPVVGDKVVVNPIQILVEPVILAVGMA